MDVVLEIADQYALDRLYAHILPISAFAESARLADKSVISGNASSLIHTLSGPVSSSTWSHIVSYFPHPPISEDLSATLFASPSSVPLVSAWPRDYIPRQLFSLTAITLVGIYILYFVFAWLSYVFVFDHRMMSHPRFLKNQVRLEIAASLAAFPGMTLLTLPWFQAEVMGYSRLYKNVDEYGWLYFFFSIFWFLFCTDLGVYFIHRSLHHPLLYKTFHKPHHKWLVPTPFASHAFHPVDGYAQSMPYHIFIFIFPLHRLLYLGLFVFVNFWTILIHDSDMITGHPLEKVINGPAHHTLHHLYFTVNYGQYFTWADRVGKSYRQPEPSLDPLLVAQKHAAKADESKKED